MWTPTFCDWFASRISSSDISALHGLLVLVISTTYHARTLLSFGIVMAPLDCVLVLQQHSAFGSSFHQDEEFVTALINWQFAACNSVLIDLAKAERRWTEKNITHGLHWRLCNVEQNFCSPSFFMSWNWFWLIEMLSETKHEV